jgi:hypothetical protein
MLMTAPLLRQLNLLHHQKSQDYTGITCYTIIMSFALLLKKFQAAPALTKNQKE